MTIFLRALWGPFGVSETRYGQAVTNPPHGYVLQIDWHFFGIREDNSMGHWTLRYDAAKRKFVVFLSGCASKAVFAPAHPDAFIPDRPMVHGRTYVDILKKRLSSAETARAVAASISRPV